MEELVLVFFMLRQFKLAIQFKIFLKQQYFIKIAMIIL
jgi:hypothetical protein